MNIIRIFFEFLPLLLLFIGVLIIVRGRRRVARMTMAERKEHLERERRHPDMLDPTNLLGTTNPCSPNYMGGGHNDD